MYSYGRFVSFLIFSPGPMAEVTQWLTPALDAVSVTGPLYGMSQSNIPVSKGG